MESQSQEYSQQQLLEVLQDLLRPNQDIWSIPLYEYLDSFYQNLTAISFEESFDPDSFNFSQAGLLISRSTAVLAQKVKQLYDLVTQASTQSEENQPSQSKRKKKQTDFVVNDKLAPIDDPDEVDTTLNDEDLPRIEITTMPKIPFCLLQSLDVRDQGDSAPFRINNVPDQRHCVILLDSSQVIPDEPEEVFDDPPKPPYFVPPNTQVPLPIPLPQMEDFGGVGGGFESDDFTEVTEEVLTPEKTRPKVETEEQYSEPTLLDPDQEGFRFVLRPFKKMKKIKIPSSFHENSGKDSSKISLKKPFHLDLFKEPFEKLKKS